MASDRASVSVVLCEHRSFWCDGGGDGDVSTHN